MADIEKIFVIDIDNKLLTKSTDESRKAVNELTKGLKELRNEEKENNKAIDEQIKKLNELKSADEQNIKLIAEAESEMSELLKTRDSLNSSIVDQTNVLKVNQKELRQNVKLETDLIAANEAQAGSIEQLRKKLSVVSVQWAKLSKEERENTKAGKALSKQKSELTTKLKAEEEATGDARRNVGNYSDAIAEAIPGIGGAVKGFEELTRATLAFVLTPIGAFITAIVVVFKLLKGAFNRSLASQEKLNKVTGKLSAAFGVLLDLLIPVVDFILDQVLSAFEEMGNAVVFVIEKLEEWGIISKETADKVKEDMDKNTKAADDLASAERRLIETSIALQKAQLKFQTQAEKLRQIRDDESKSIAERVKANEDLGKLLLSQAAAERNLANQALKIARQREQVNGRSLESIQEIGDAEIKLAEIKERITSQQSEQLSNLNSLRKEEADNIKLEKDNAAKENTEREEKAAQESLRILEERIAKTAQFLDEEKQRRLTNEENERLLEDEGILNQLDLERTALEAKYQQEIEFAEKIGADTTLIERKFSKAREEINKAEAGAKLAIAGGFASSIASIAGESTAIGKAAAVAATLINTWAGAQAVFAQTPGELIVKSAAAAAAVAVGLRNVQKILKVKTDIPGASSSGGSPGAGGSASTPSVAPPSPIAPQVNEGIVSRDNINVVSSQGISLQPTLLESDVEAAQKQQIANNETAVI